MPNTESTVKTVNVANDIYYFRIIDSSGSNVQQLWKMDASTYATSKVKSFGALFSPYGEVSLATAVNNIMYFVIYISPGDQQLWISDGTEAGTKPLFMASKIYAFFVLIMNCFSLHLVIPMQQSMVCTKQTVPPQIQFS